jgi:hypothetical protein
VGSIGEVKCECCFNFCTSLRTNTVVVAAAATTKHLAEQVTHATCAHVAVVEPERTRRMAALATMAKR